MVGDDSNGSVTLPVGHFRFELEITRFMLLPAYKGSVFRSALGKVLRPTKCHSNEAKCHGRPDCFDCLYGAIFEPIPPHGCPDAGRIEDAPRPYVLTPPLTLRKSFHPGDFLAFELALIGSALDKLPFLLDAVTEVGRQGIGRKLENRRGTYKVVRVGVEVRDEALPMLDCPPQALYSNLPNDNALPGTPWKDIHTLSLTFVTPLCLKERGEPVIHLTFPLLFERLVQRIFLLSALYGPKRGMPDFSSLIQKAQAISVTKSNLFSYAWVRHSGKQQRNMRLVGIKGSIRLAWISTEVKSANIGSLKD
jgi:hypothetical protein